MSKVGDALLCRILPILVEQVASMFKVALEERTTSSRFIISQWAQ